MQQANFFNDNEQPIVTAHNIEGGVRLILRDPLGDLTGRALCRRLRTTCPISGAHMQDDQNVICSAGKAAPIFLGALGNLLKAETLSFLSEEREPDIIGQQTSLF